MGRVGYCTACGRYVELTEDLACSAGHPRSQVRDVRDSMPSVVAGASAAVSPGRAAQVAEQGPQVSANTERAMSVIGALVVFVPAVAIVVAGTALSVPQFTSMGMSTGMSWLAGLASFGATVGGAVVWGYLRNQRRKR